jgi:hypothetical protein
MVLFLSLMFTSVRRTRPAKALSFLRLAGRYAEGQAMATGFE